MYQERIREIYDHLSPAYRRVADYLLNHYREAAFMTAAEVGRAAPADTASVVRFAQRLGYPGFPELIADVQEEVKRDLRKVYEPGPADFTPSSLFRRSLIEDRNSLDYILLHVRDQDIEVAVSMLEVTRRVFIAAEGSGAYLVEAFGLRLQAMGYNVVLLPGDSMARAALVSALAPDDVVIGLGLSAGTPGVAVTLKIAREGGAHTIAIVGTLNNAAARVAECVLHSPTHASGMLYSFDAACSVFHALLQVLVSRRGEQAVDGAVRVDQLLRRFVQVWREPFASVQDILNESNPSDTPDA